MEQPGKDEGAKRERELALLEEAAHFLAAASRPDDIYPIIVRLAALIGATEERHWRASYLALEGGVLRRIAIHDDAEIDLGSREYPLDEYPTLRRVIEGEEMFTDMSTPMLMPVETAEAVARAQLGSAVMLPVAQGGEVYGILALSTRDRLSRDDLRQQRLRAVAHLAGLAIANARLLAEQEQVAARAHALEIAKSRFLNLAAHEMRGPLTVIRGYADMLGDGSLGPLTERMAVALGALRGKADEMSRLVVMMMETARLEEGRLELHPSQVDLRDVARDVVRVLAPLIGEAHALRVVDCEEPLVVHGDPDRISTVVANLLDNACKYSPPGTPVEVRCVAGEGRAMVAVSDRGIGLSDDDMTVLFTRFGRVVSAQTSHIGGTGLGLWLSREIARMHGGEIEVRSARGEGSTFTLVLPTVAR
jgi:signal transduction histidine kinase